MKAIGDEYGVENMEEEEEDRGLEKSRERAICALSFLAGRYKVWLLAQQAANNASKCVLIFPRRDWNAVCMFDFDPILEKWTFRLKISYY